MNQLIAVRDQVIIEEEYKEKIGSFYVPEQYQKQSADFTGKVISVGPESPYYDELKPGDRIMYRRFEGFRINVNEKTYLSLRERWVAGRVLEE